MFSRFICILCICVCVCFNFVIRHLCATINQLIDSVSEDYTSPLNLTELSPLYTWDGKRRDKMSADTLVAYREIVGSCRDTRVSRFGALNGMDLSRLFYYLLIAILCRILLCRKKHDSRVSGSDISIKCYANKRKFRRDWGALSGPENVHITTLRTRRRPTYIISYAFGTHEWLPVLVS